MGTRENHGYVEDLARSDWWLTPEELIHYGIDRVDMCQDFLSFKAWDRVVRRVLTEESWSYVLDNKWWFDLCYTNQGFNLPQTYGLLHPVAGHFRSGLLFREPEHLVDWLREVDVNNFVLKPVAGGASMGVLVVREVKLSTDDVSFLMQDGQRLSLSGLWSGLKIGFRGVQGYLLQERLNLHLNLKASGLDFPYSLRVVTTVDPDGEPHILISVMYVGRSGDMVNKWEEGALSIYVDRRTGTLGQGRTLPRFGTGWYSAHPDNGASFEGLRLPDWDAAIQICLDAARRTPGCRMVCWEVLFTDSGPRLIEGNLGFGLTMLQVHTPGFLKDGDFRDCLEGVGADLPDGTRGWVRRNSVPPLRKFLARQKKRLSWL